MRVVCEGIGAGKLCSLAYMRASEHALAGRKLRCSVLETHHNQRNWRDKLKMSWDTEKKNRLNAIS